VVEEVRVGHRRPRQRRERQPGVLGGLEDAAPVQRHQRPLQVEHEVGAAVADFVLDRKSTRLNSSHLGISYAVFCLKKKNTQSRKSTSPTLRHCPSRLTHQHYFNSHYY